MKVRPLEHLSESVAIYRRHPVVSSALGLSIVLSVCALCCGLGVIAIPWFGCELYAFQVAAGTGEKVTRKRAWLSAGLFILASATLVVVASAISALGVDFSGEDAITDARRIGLSIAGVTLAMLFVVPFTYAPRILVDRGGTIGAAALESARFFVRDSLSGHLALVVLAHFIQSAPLTIGAIIALALADASAIPFVLLSVTPFLAATVPIGQGVITAAWVARRHRLTDASARRPAGKTPLWLSAFVSLVWISPGLSLALVIASLVSPSALVVVDVPPDGEALVSVDVDGARRIAIPDTALTIEIDDESAAIVASDGGGVGDLPLGSDAQIAHVDVIRSRDQFTIDLTSEGLRRRVVIDRAGVRQDDDLRTRLTQRLPRWGLLVLALALLLTPLILTRVVVEIAELRESSCRPVDALSDHELDERRAEVMKSSVVWTSLVVPLSLAALAAGLIALF